MLSRDGWGGLAVLAASLLLFGLTFGLKDNPLVPVSPGFYPRVVLGLTALLSLALVVADWRARATRKSSPASEHPNYGLVGLMFVVFGLYCGALGYLGFRLSTLLYIGACNAILEPPRGGKGAARDWLRVVLLALIATGAIWLVFERQLSVLLPRGRWTNF
ncbi:MAG: tripartite tricarboxylate transporter TctB family protein [Betaproteobacteria bacterium]